MRGKIKYVILLTILMIGCSLNLVYGYTGTGSLNNPYIVTEEAELKEVLTKKSNNDSWVYVAINSDISITSTIKIEKGNFRIYAKGENRTIKRTSNLNESINDSQDPKYCMKVMGTSQVVLGYKRNEYILRLGGNKDNIPETRQTSGWVNIDSLATVTIGENGHVTNVRNNEKSDEGAPIRTEGKIIVNGEISNCVGANGGAIKAISGEVTINKTAKIHNCQSQTEGGAIHISSQGKIVMNGGKIYRCVSKEEGGGIFIAQNSRGEIVSGDIYENESGNSAGGVFSGYGSTLIVGTTDGKGPSIYYNKASGSGGGVRCNGGITDNAGGITYFFGGTISNNYSGKNGGGISCGESGSKGVSKIILRDMYIMGNTSEATGGGVWLPAVAEGINTDYVVLTRCSINSNESKQSTGGIMIHCDVVAIDNEISNNICKSYGGGIFVDDNAVFTLHSGMITENRCEGKGQGIYLKGKFKILSDAYVSSDNEVYLTSGTFIEIIGKLNKKNGYIAVIDSAVKSNGTKLVKAGYSNTDGAKELYYSGTPEDEYIPKGVIKKYECINLGSNQCLRPSNNVAGYDDKWIIISQQYTVSYKKNCSDKVDNMPETQIKFWNESIVTSTNKISRAGYETDESKHWNLISDGSGTLIKPGSLYSLNGNRELYAIWKKIEVSQLFITAVDRYYVVGQNITLNNKEVLKKVTVEDNLKTGKKYEIKVIQIKDKISGDIISGNQLLLENHINTSGSGAYELTIYVNEGKVEKKGIFNIYILNTLLQNGKTRFISKRYWYTMDISSKWYSQLKPQLMSSMSKVQGQGIYVINISNTRLQQVKQNLKANGYNITQEMNKTVAGWW